MFQSPNALSTPFVPQHTVNTPTYVDHDHVRDAAQRRSDDFVFPRATRVSTVFMPRRHDLVFSLPSTTFLHKTDPGVFATLNGVLADKKDEVRFQGVAVAPIANGFDNGLDTNLTIQVRGSATIYNNSADAFLIGDMVVWEYPDASAVSPDGRVCAELKRATRRDDAALKRLVGTCIKGGGPGSAIEVLIGERK